MIGIYKVTSPIGRIYIGQSIDVEKRLNSYKAGWGYRHSIRLRRSIEKHGWEKHTVEILIECKQMDLNFWEEYFIKEHDCFDTHHGLNLRSGGDSQLNSVETKIRMGNSQRGKIITEEMRKKLRLYNLGKSRPQHEKDKISATMKGLVKSEIHLKNIRKSLKESEKAKLNVRKLHEARKKKVIDSASGKVYDSARELFQVENTGCSYSHLVSILNGSKKNNTTYQYL